MDDDPYRLQHQRRLAYMPWLWARLKPHQRAWAEPWQRALQEELAALERIHFGEDCFVAPQAALFAEPHRAIHLGDRVRIAAEVFLHGPIYCGDDVGINVGVVIDGGAAGVRIGSGSRIASHVSIYAWNHGISPKTPVRTQKTTSSGIQLGEDVWIGSRACITDGVCVGDHAVVGMGSVVTGDVEPWSIVAGNPARVIGSRLDR